MRRRSGGDRLARDLSIVILDKLPAGGGDIGAERVADRRDEAGVAEDRGEGIAFGPLGGVQVWC